MLATGGQHVSALHGSLPLPHRVPCSPIPAVVLPVRGAGQRTQPLEAGVPCSSTAGLRQNLSRQHRSLLRQHVSCSAANGAATAERANSFPIDRDSHAGPKILIAGGGIGGLVLAVGLLRKGYNVQVFERDLTAIRGEGKYRGPIQVQSNALAALEALHPGVAEAVLAEGCITGDRVNGLCDGVTGKWYVKFDTFHPAVERGLPVTRVISRVTLQRLLAEAACELGGEGVLLNDCHVVDYEEEVGQDGTKTVWAVLEDGRRFQGDVLIGADGIWSKVRRKLVGPTEPAYSQYTCYTGISDFTPPDIDTVGYRVFLGNGKYFVSSDVGGGKMQWYGFHKEPAGGTDEPGKKKERLLDIFGHWTDMVTDLIRATPEDDVLRRDIYDRPPIFTWTRGRVALLGDSAHAMQPNLGQGGCMAIEDGYQLAVDISAAHDAALAAGKPADWEAVLKGYQSKRLLRASVIHGLAGMAAIMASTYKAYMGEGLGPLSWIQKYKIPHFGRVGGYFAMNLTMPTVLGWVLGGNTGAFRAADRAPHCRIADKPQGFDEKDFHTFMSDDDALISAARARWLLVPASIQPDVNGFVAPTSSSPSSSADASASGASRGVFADGTIDGVQIARPPGSIEIDDGGLAVGSSANCDVVLGDAAVAERHALVQKAEGGYWVTDLGAAGGTWLNDRRLAPHQRQRLCPGDLLEFGAREAPHLAFNIKMCHAALFPGGGGAGAAAAARAAARAVPGAQASERERELVAN